MTRTPLQQQAVEAVRAMGAAQKEYDDYDGPLEGYASSSLWQELLHYNRVAHQTAVAAIRELADNEGE